MRGSLWSAFLPKSLAWAKKSECCSCNFRRRWNSTHAWRAIFLRCCVTAMKVPSFASHDTQVGSRQWRRNISFDFKSGGWPPIRRACQRQKRQADGWAPTTTGQGQRFIIGYTVRHTSTGRCIQASASSNGRKNLFHCLAPATCGASSTIQQVAARSATHWN